MITSQGLVHALHLWSHPLSKMQAQVPSGTLIRCMANTQHDAERLHYTIPRKSELGACTNLKGQCTWTKVTCNSHGQDECECEDNWDM